MQITEVRVTLRDEPKLKGFANVTFDNVFVVRGMKIIAGQNGFFVSMPSRRRSDGSHQDVAHPITVEMRKAVEAAVLEAYHIELANNPPRPPRGNVAPPPSPPLFSSVKHVKEGNR